MRGERGGREGGRRERREGKGRGGGEDIHYDLEPRGLHWWRSKRGTLPAA